MMRTLSVQRLQLTADPDDWTWVRWQWTQPGAKPMPFFHAFGFPLWEDPEDNPAVGPQIRIEGGQWRGEETSPFPGTDIDGPVGMWQGGVPLSARDPAGEVMEHCGAEIWNTDWPVDWIYEMDVTPPSFFVGRRGNPRSWLTGPATLPTPVGLDTDTLVIVALVQAAGMTMGDPTGFGAPFFTWTGDNDLKVRLYQFRYVSQGGVYQYHVPPFGVASLAAVWIEHAANAVAGGGNHGTGTVVTALSADASSPQTMLVVWGFNEADFEIWDDPAGMTDCFTVPINGMVQCWREEDIPPGPTGDRTANTLAGGAWIAVQLTVPPG